MTSVVMARIVVMALVGAAAGGCCRSGDCAQARLLSGGGLDDPSGGPRDDPLADPFRPPLTVAQLRSRRGRRAPRRPSKL